MSSPIMQTRQTGITLIEFSIVALLLFVLLFGIIEFSRWMFVWNTLTQSVNRGALFAARTCNDPTKNPQWLQQIQNVTLFNNPDGKGTNILPALTTANVVAVYSGCLPQDLAPPTPPTTATVCIKGYTHELLIPGFDLSRTSMISASVPIESLGTDIAGCKPACNTSGTVPPCP